MELLRERQQWIPWRIGVNLEVLANASGKRQIRQDVERVIDVKAGEWIGKVKLWIPGRLIKDVPLAQCIGLQTEKDILPEESSWIVVCYGIVVKVYAELDVVLALGQGHVVCELPLVLTQIVIRESRVSHEEHTG